MRHRRAERCAMRAEAALEAGHEEEARNALAEARALNPQAPDFETVAELVRERQAAALAAAARARARRTGAFAVLGATVATAAITFWIGSTDANIDTGAPAPAHAASTTTASPIAEPAAPVQKPQEQPGAVTSATDLTTAVNEAESPLRTTASPESPVRTTGSADRPVSGAERPPTLPAWQPTFTTPPVSQTSGAATAEPSLPPVRDVDPSIPLTRAAPPAPDTNAIRGNVPPPRGPEGLVKELPSADLPGVSPPRTPAPQPVSQPEAPTEESRVRAVLARFEAAYSTLDAPAARSVWPSVDARSLERAFNSLESQQVSLGRCSIVLSGATARAECSGSMSWTPKVGGGRHTEARYWEFDLASRNGTWQIVRASGR